MYTCKEYKTISGGNRNFVRLSLAETAPSNKEQCLRPQDLEEARLDTKELRSSHL